MKLAAILTMLVLVVFGCSTQPTQNNEQFISINKNWQFRQADSGQWLPATVPGCVHTDLLANGKIDDPFYRLNEHQQQWIDKVDWEYKTTINATDSLLALNNIEIKFDGLDTHAEVFINDSLILQANNMFREWKADIKKFLHPGSNELKIRLKSPIAYGLKKYDEQGYEIPVSGNDLSEIGGLGNKKVSIYSRKAPYHFGWDWGPRFVTSGIWRPVTLHAWNNISFNDFQVYQDHLDTTLARLNLTATVESQIKTQYTAEIWIEDIKFYETTVKINRGENLLQLPVEIKDPDLWWPNGLGKQTLYRVELKIKNGDELCSSAKKRIGLRNLEMVQEKDSSGTSFYFKVNGHPVFMKGANYIPQDVFLNRVTPDQYLHLVQTAADCNMNMLRVWGGGIYENNIFYDLCDEKGILIWQDFMFACNMYPGDQAFLENVKAETYDNVHRLRNHPCIALWCGNNEILSAWMNWGYQKQVAERFGGAIADTIGKAYDDLFHHILPDVVKEVDPDRYYHSSSPSAGFGAKETFTAGDIHYWGVWWGKESFATYRTVKSRFFSEYGFQSFPAFSSVMRYTKPEDYNIYSEVMNSHQRSSIGNVTIEEYLLRDYKKPNDFQSFLYISQLLQAEGIKTAIKLHRKSKPYTMGSLYWQIDDCWPVASWSSMDYYGQWKALQYFAKKAFRPVIMVADNYQGQTTINIVSDRLQPAHLNLKLTLQKFTGEIIWQMQKPVAIEANGNIQPYYMATSKVLDGSNPARVMLVMSLIENDSLIDHDILYFKPVKDLILPKPAITKKIEKTERGFTITLTSPTLVKNVFLTADELNFEGSFTDNYFDMEPGKYYQLSFNTSVSLQLFEKKLKMMSVYDTW